MINMLLEHNLMTEMNCGANYTCILNDNSLFLPTEYKVLQSQNNNCFVKCMKMLYDGKVQFYYLTSQYQPFGSLLSMLSPDSFLTVVSGLFADIIDVKNNGFLSCLNINIDLDHIYIDTTNYQVKLVYIPTGKRLFTDNAQFESELRTGLVKVISKTPSLASSKTMQLMQDLSNGMLSLEDLHKRIKGNQVIEWGGRKDTSPVASTERKCRLIAVNSPMQTVIDVNKDDFVIGKREDSVDGVITFNKMISRVHCKITQKNGDICIVDLHSANGTYLNRMRLQPDQLYPIKDGDIVRLANSEFKIQIG